MTCAARVQVGLVRVWRWSGKRSHTQTHHAGALQPVAGVGEGRKRNIHSARLQHEERSLAAAAAQAAGGAARL